MTQPYKKKLIEVALPLDAINKACKDDKDRKTGHIRNLHKWYAPMPLPAWRAALFASIVDDPGDETKDPKAKGKREDLFNALQSILPLDAAKHPVLFEPIRKLLRGAMKDLPTVIDPFCGGGSTILEAQRLGFRTMGSDLNPLPLLITTVLTRYPSLFGDISPINPKARQKGGLQGGSDFGLVDDVHYYAGEIGKRAKRELAQYFPNLNVTINGRRHNATVLSWIWCRTVKCPNPACGIEAPLASSYDLTRANKNSGIAQWIEPVVTHSTGRTVVDYKIGTGAGGPPKPPKTGHGAKFQCVSCKAVIDEKYLRTTAQADGLGFALMACVVKTDEGKRVYLPPNPEVLATVKSPDVAWFPDLELSTHPQYMGAPRYGMRKVGDLFTPRQLKTLDVFASIVRDFRTQIESDAATILGVRASEYAKAVTTILALCVSKMSQSHNVLVRWKLDSRNGSGKPLPAFDTQTVPIVWDFAENNPFGGSVGDWEATVVPTALRAFDFTVRDAVPAEINQADARRAFEIGTGPVLVATDPPYYDNVPYADLSDVFYPLLRYILQDVHRELFSTVRAPRMNELVADYYRFDGNRQLAQDYFLNGFRDVFIGLKKRIHPDVPMTVVYSFKQQESRDNSDTASTGWEVMLRALIEAGFMITATWPVRTTLDNRSRDIDSNALASAILIVCRARNESVGKVTRRDFISDLARELPEAVRHLQASSIAPVDLQQAMIGPGMAVFSKYEAVLEADGNYLSVRDALGLINVTLDSILADQDGDFDADTRWALSWFEQFGFADGEFGVAETLSKAKNTSVSGIVDAGIGLSRAGKVRLLKPEELPADWSPEGDKRLTVWETVHHLIRTLNQGESVAATLVAHLGSRAEVARELAYRLYSMCERKKRSQEALAYNALVQSWPEIIRLAQQRPVASQTGLFEEGQ
jgi:putative DNA methylase